MKRLIIASLMILAIALASGCSSAELKAADVYQKSVEATQKLDSMAMNMTVKQQIEQGANKMNSDIGMDMNIILHPAMKFSATMNITLLKTPTIKTEIVYTPEGLAMKDPATGKWEKLPSDQVDKALSGINMDQMNPVKQLETLKPYIDQLALTSTSDTYQIEVKLAGDKMNNFIMDQMKQNGNPQVLEQMKQSDLKINSMHYIYTVDRKTYLPKAIDLDMDMQMTIKNQTMHMIQSMKGQYTNLNAVKDITLPAEAK
jgi:hypothetical protein